MYRVLLVGGETYPILLLRSILTMMGVTQIIQIEDSESAIDLLSRENIHTIFYDPKSPRCHGMPFPVAARRKESVINPLVPIFALQERARRGDVEQARDAGVTDVITIPISPRTLMTKMKAAPRNFILAKEFFGPDRRARSRDAWFGSDRRIRTARKQKVDFVQV